VDYVLARLQQGCGVQGNGARALHFGGYQRARGYESEGSVVSKTHKKAAS
jgi:hypothetical protein